MSDHGDPDPGLASELRLGAGREWAEEAAEDERLTELLRRRRLSLVEVMRDLAHRGARVSIEAGGHTFSGVVVAACDDYATLEGAGHITEVRYQAGAWSVIAADQPVQGSSTLTAETFHGRLHEHAAAGTRLQLALSGRIAITGVIEVVATDHIEFTDVDDRQLYVPINRILGTSRSTDPH
ncbi:MAG TPA: hypothetical protein EYP73_00365 [Acidimicrobiia bacterium]|nr:hypothetical protein [Acidimicrobiia bacterium]